MKCNFFLYIEEIIKSHLNLLMLNDQKEGGHGCIWGFAGNLFVFYCKMF